ncbi:hypothetical protein SAMN05421687_11536 [Salimicrobium flavidum]|uniref:Uncharacterized protein n=1 Tax=Salimicrobium flavidum TaxID=570947 RepID=A0A1N7KQ21_9BACI|nr:hypothetical protein SAMN05421687_11536 [Salimicrobium flavidum]
MIYYFRFFIFMIIGQSIWHLVVSSYEEKLLDIVGISFFATLFKWLLDNPWSGKDETE